MHETAQDLRVLQHLLDSSYEQAGEHLRSIFTSERRMSAEETARLLRGVFVLNVATVTAACEPMVAPVDGRYTGAKSSSGFPPARCAVAISARGHR